MGFMFRMMGGVADTGVEQQPVVWSKRNSKYDPAVYDLDAVERRIPMSGKKNGYGGVYWP